MELKSKADAVAKIALDIDFNLQDSAATTKSLLLALNRAYEAGVEEGVNLAGRHHAQVMEVISKVLTP